MSYESVVLADTPTAYWRMESTSDPVQDASPNNRDLSLINAPSGGTGPFTLGNCLHLNGTDEYGEVGDGAHFDTGDYFTYECWVNFDTLRNQGLIGKGSSGAVLGIITIGGGVWRLQGAKNGVTGLVDASGPNLATGTWYHVVWTSNGTGVHKLYVDGSDVTGSTSSSAITNNSNPIRIGYNDGFGDKLDGLIDEVAIYNYALSSGQVSAHYAASQAVDVTVNADVTDVNIDTTGLDPTVDAEVAGHVTVDATQANVAVNGHTLPNIENLIASTSDIEVNAWDASFYTVYQNYDNLITSAGPVRWWKFSGNGDEAINGYTLGGGGSNSYSTDGAITGTAVDQYLLSADGDFRTSTHNASEIGYNNSHGATIEFFIRTNKTTGLFMNFSTAVTGTYTSSTSYSYGEAFDYIGYATVTYQLNGGTGIGWGTNNGYLARANSFVSSGPVTADGTGSASSPASAMSAALSNALSQSIDSQVSPQWITTDKYVADGNWHHVVVSTVRNGDGSFSHATYVDGVQSSVSIGTIQAQTEYQGNVSLGYVRKSFTGSQGTVSKVLESGGTGFELDELAYYNYGLTAAAALEHSSSRDGTIISDPSIEVAQEAANVGVAGEAPTINISKTIDVTPSNIAISEQSAIISGSGDILYGGDAGLISIAGQAPTIEAVRNRNVQLTQTENIAVTAHDVSVYTTIDDLSFFFVPPSETSVSAFDAQQLTSINLGAFLFAQEKIVKFRVANTSRFNVVFNVSTFTANTGLIEHINYSDDGVSYSTNLSTAVVEPNQISEVLYLRLLVPAAFATGDGNFMINVEPINVDASN